jgi:AcrR family transcriptional regulator
MAAFRLFCQKGYSCTSIQDIADDAGVQKSILYYYFESKEGLYTTLLTESASRLRGLLDSALTDAGIQCPLSTLLAEPSGSDAAPGGTRRAKSALPRLPAGTSVAHLLGHFVETLLSAARDHREPVRFFMTHIFAPDADRPPVSIDEMQQITQRITQKLVRQGQLRGELRGDADLLERLLLGAVQYSITRHLRQPDQEPLLPGTGRRLVRALLHGFIGPKPVPSGAPKPKPASSAKARPPARKSTSKSTPKSTPKSGSKSTSRSAKKTPTRSRRKARSDLQQR